MSYLKTPLASCSRPWKGQPNSAGNARLDRLTYTLPAPLAAAVNESLGEWGAQGKVRSLWARDASLWSGKDEGQWLGWLGITNGQLAHIERLRSIRQAAKSAGFTHALLLGMGGSSLGPEVIKTTFGAISGFPELFVLDSTDPAQVKAFENRVDLKNTLFIVSSKSGSTLEPNVFKQYFFELISRRVGAKEAGKRFIAITDPGSKMQQIAEGDGFRRVFLGWPNIGGRYSVLSDFGLVPAAIMGVDVAKLLDRTEEMVCACMPSVPVAENPGVVLGTILGVAAKTFGRDKITIVASPRIANLGAWLEQLLAESTGKDGKGLIPIDREALGKPDVYGRDRLFIYLRSSSTEDSRAGCAGGRARTRRTSAGSYCLERSLRSRTRVFPLGVRHCGGRLDSWYPSVRSTGCGSKQDRNAKADRRLRKKRGSASRGAHFHRARDRALHGREERSSAYETSPTAR